MNNLHWEDFYSLKELGELKKTSNPVSAVYMWGWMADNNRFRAYYVGKANNLFQRLFQHVGNFNGGLYSIYDENYVKSADFRPLKKVDGKNLLYIPKEIDSFIKFRDNKRIQNTKDSLLDQVLFTWAKTKSELNSDLEKHIASELRKFGRYIGATVRGKSQIEDVTFTGNHEVIRLFNFD